MGNSEHILSSDNISVGFQKKSENILLLENIGLKIKQGELIGLIGRNGAGKSTLLRCMARLQQVLDGHIFINDRDIHSIHPGELSRLISYVSSGVEFTDSMTVKELVSLGRFPYTNWMGRLTSEDIKLISEALTSVGIEHLEKRKLSEISDGERQKAMIARTLAQDTPIIILDEPTAYLDLPSKFDIISLLYMLTQKGKTVIYSTHDLNIALRFSDKIWLIDNRTIHDGSPEDLILNHTLSGIFDSDKIFLNEMSGDFELRKYPAKKISLECEFPNLFYWTQQALQRSGYEIVKPDSNTFHVTVEKSNNIIIWKFQRFNENLIFDSIYDMLSAL